MIQVGILNSLGDEDHIYVLTCWSAKQRCNSSHVYLTRSKAPIILVFFEYLLFFLIFPDNFSVFTIYCCWINSLSVFFIIKKRCRFIKTMSDFDIFSPSSKVRRLPFFNYSSMHNSKQNLL